MAEADEVIVGWHTSSSSSSSSCVEVQVETRHVRVRDSKDREGAELAFTYTEWRAFVSGVRLGEFDLPAE